MNDLNQYFAATHFSDTSTRSYGPNQIGARVQILHNIDSQLDEVDIILIGCGEQRGAGIAHTSFAPDSIRQELYQLYLWHDTLRIGDAGNLVLGAELEDTYSALATVLSALIEQNKKVILIGGTHDLTLGQYKAYQQLKRLCNAVVIDSKIDLRDEERSSDQGFLMEMLTGKNNFIRHYTHLGFQSYLVDPTVLQTLDRLRFDCVRLGILKEDLSLAEPELRSADMVSIDMMSLRHSEASYLENASPNGFWNQELCELARYAAMNDAWSTIAFYGYLPEADVEDAGAKAIAQAIWYIFDGVHTQQGEASFDNRGAFETHEVIFTDIETQFLRSKRTGRWWMQLSDGSFTPCSYRDFVTAASNDIPERWLRANERIV